MSGVDKKRGDGGFSRRGVCSQFLHLDHVGHVQLVQLDLVDAQPLARGARRLDHVRGRAAPRGRRELGGHGGATAPCGQVGFAVTAEVRFVEGQAEARERRRDERERRRAVPLGRVHKVEASRLGGGGHAGDPCLVLLRLAQPGDGADAERGQVERADGRAVGEGRRAPVVCCRAAAERPKGSDRDVDGSHV